MVGYRTCTELTQELMPSAGMDSRCSQTIAPEQVYIALWKDKGNATLIF